MANDHTKVEVPALPKCDFCKLDVDNNVPGSSRRDALYDGRTSAGPWAYMCLPHFEAYGIGLGLGKGQELVAR